MKVRGLFLFALLLSISHLSAQVTVSVLTDQDEFLQGEALPVKARIVNRSGQTLTLGRDNSWLKFSIEARDGYVVLQTGEVPVKQEFTLESSERATVSANLAPYFHLPKAGHYFIRATVVIPQWNQEITSDPRPFDVIEGSKLWEQEFGVPRGINSTNTEPEMRRYALQEANYLNNLMLYVQVTESGGKLNKVFPIGRLLSFSLPEPEVDKVSNLHVLYQSGPRTYSYTVINPDGDIIMRQTYDVTTRPRLMRDDDGFFAVVGGVRHPNHNDIPQPDSAKSSAPASP